MLILVKCDPCTEAKIACRRMLGAGPDFACQKCYDRKQECERSSSRYCRVFTHQSCAASNPLPPPVPHPRHASRAASNMVAGSSHLPPVAKRRHTLKAAGFDVPFPAIEREGLYTGLDPEHAALFWRSELEHSEVMIDVLYRQCDFHRQQLDEALVWCQVSPPDDSPHPKCVQLTGPALPRGRTLSERRDKAQRRSDPVPEESSQDKGKRRADPAEGDDEAEEFSGEAEDWFGL
jgi:hypothetical protein